MPLARATLVLLWLLLALPLACGSDEGPIQAGGNSGPVVDDALPTPELACPEYTSAAYPEMALLVVEKSASLGAIDGTFNVSSTGLASYTIPLNLPPGRRLAPSLSLVVDAFAGVAISGLSSIQRCGANLVEDNEIHGVRLDSSDELCLDGKRLVSIGTGNDEVGVFQEFRTFPDTQTRIRGYGAPTANGFDVGSLVTYSANGLVAHYGKTANSRVSWRNVTRVWNKELEMDRRGNTIRYKYAAINGSGKSPSTQEVVIDTITYTGFIDENGVESFGDAVVDFQYNDDPRHGKLFYEGEEVSKRLQLDRIDMLAGGVNVRSYRLAYDEDALTNRALLRRVDECAQGDLAQCKPATFFEWTQATNGGFSPITTQVNVPTKNEDDQFSWTVADVTGDGAPDVITSTSDANSGLNQWFVYKSLGAGTLANPVEWLGAPFPQGFGKQWQITPVDENGDGRIDLLIDQPDGATWSHMHVLRSVASPAPHFELVKIPIPRTSHHRASEFTVESHSGMAVADIDADGMNDIVTCHDLRTWYGVGEYVPDNCDDGADCKPSFRPRLADTIVMSSIPGVTTGSWKTSQDWAACQFLNASQLTCWRCSGYSHILRRYV